MILIFKLAKKEMKYVYEILFCFLCCGIIGWVYETIFVLFQSGRMTDRGILFISHIHGYPFVWGLPLILIYGIGGAVLIWGFKPLANKPVLLFLISMAAMTLFEYLTAVFCELVLGQTLWDYSKEFMNFQGRICLRASVSWGLLGILAVKVFGPLFHKIYNKIKYVKVLHIIIIVLVIYVLICYLLRATLFPDMVAHMA